MKNTKTLIQELKSDTHRSLLTDIYVDEEKIDYQTNRYVKAIENFETNFGEAQVTIFSAPGRSEIGGNHTDHQHGHVIAASINNDAIAIVTPTDDGQVKIISDTSPMITVELNKIEKSKSEEGTTIALIKGVLFGLKDRGYKVDGFSAFITSDVLIGAGLSSSAAFETVIGTILSGLYNDMKISPVEIAIIGQFAENVYFGKPCGLMDQMACSVGSLVHIDFAEPAKPVIDKIDFDISAHGYSLCITDTKGSHADLTAEYAAIPTEMKAVAAELGKEVLRDITLEDIFKHIHSLRSHHGDRAVLRAIHFIEENKRAIKEADALRSGDIKAFFATVRDSGNSSFQYLQNVYTSQDTCHQNVSIALCASDAVLKGNGVSRVHGGGFAGTIQAFVKNEAVFEYKNTMDTIFGKGACSVLKIRKYGGMKVL